MTSNNLTPAQISEILALLLKEDKSGLAYSINHMNGVGYSFLMAAYTRKELREKVKDMEAFFYKLSSFQTCKHIFAK